MNRDLEIDCNANQGIEGKQSARLDEETKLERVAPELTEEVAALFAILKQHRAESIRRYRISTEHKTESKLSRLFAGFIIVSAVLYVTTHVPATAWASLNNPIAIIQGLLLLAYGIALVFVVSSALAMKSYFNDAAGSLLDLLGPTIQSEVALFAQLDKYSTTSIAYISELLKFSFEQLTFVKSNLVGAVEKIGLFPGIIATALAFNQAIENSGGLLIQILSFVMAGIYISVYPVLFSSIRFKQYGLILEQYLKLERVKEAG